MSGEALYAQWCLTHARYQPAWWQLDAVEKEAWHQLASDVEWR
jgi:hypothetical protein